MNICQLSFLIIVMVSTPIIGGGLKEKVLFWKNSTQHNQQPAEKLPIVYHPHYNITLAGLEKLHPFDSCKYGNVYNYLVDKVGIASNRFHTPEIVSDPDLLKVHSQEYINSLSKSAVIARITEILPAAFVPNFLLQRFLLYPMKLATGGTVKAAELALKKGWAINLSGGYHHAKCNCGGGFCVYADIPLAITKYLEQNAASNVMIIDLDAHQGNGHESYFKDDKRITIFDVYNKDIYPHDFETRARINFNHPVSSGIKDEEYLTLLAQKLPEALQQAKPNFIIYNAGTDVYKDDPLGNMKISADGIIKRDELVFQLAKEHNIPILMVLSGGYTKMSASIIGQSIENIIKNVHTIA
jgi:histone deacetylase 11